MKYTFRISFFLKKSVVRKNGKSPIIARITLNGLFSLYYRKHNEDELKLVGHGRVMDTYKKYELAYRRLQEFMLHQYSKNDIYLIF